MAGPAYAYIDFDNPNGVPDLEGLRSSRVVAFDTEATTVHLGKAQPIGISFSDKPTSGYYFPWDCTNMPWGAFDDDNGEKLFIAHNAAFDRAILKHKGIEVNNLADTMIAAHLLEKYKLSLKFLSLADLQTEIMAYHELKVPLQELSTLEQANYSFPHANTCGRLWTLYEPELKKWKLDDIFWNLEMPLVPVLSDMESEGVAVDKQALEELGEYLWKKVHIIEDTLKDFTTNPNTNFNSSDQVAKFLFEELKLPPTRPTKSGKRPSTDAKLLEPLRNASPAVGLVIAYKKYRKLIDGFVDSLIPLIYNGRIYGSFNQTGTRTGRLSSSGPNLQNIPMRTEDGRKIRRAFVARDGYVFVSGDWDQAELRMLTHYSKDPAMLAAFNEGRDIHAETAVRVFGSIAFRFKGKTLNFRIVYGGGEHHLRRKFYDAYPGVAEWTRRASLEARDMGYVRTLHGRIRTIPELWYGTDKQKEHAVREAISTIIQGSTSEMVKHGMIRAWKEFRNSDIRGVLQVHDEAVYEVPESEVDFAVDVLRRVLPTDELSVPMTVSIKVGKNWRDMKELSENSKN